MLTAETMFLEKSSLRFERFCWFVNLQWSLRMCACLMLSSFSSAHPMSPAESCTSKRSWQIVQEHLCPYRTRHWCVDVQPMPANPDRCARNQSKDLCLLAPSKKMALGYKSLLEWPLSSESNWKPLCVRREFNKRTKTWRGSDSILNSDMCHMNCMAQVCVHVSGSVLINLVMYRLLVHLMQRWSDHSFPWKQHMSAKAMFAFLKTRHPNSTTILMQYWCLTPMNAWALHFSQGYCSCELW